MFTRIKQLVRRSSREGGSNIQTFPLLRFAAVVAVAGFFALSASAGLPDEYREVGYLESSGTQYIDTGVTNLQTDGVTCTFKFLELSSGENWAFASWSGGGLRYGAYTSGALRGSSDFTATTDANGWSTATRTSFTTASTGISTYLYAQNENSKPYHLGSHIQISRFTVTRDGATFCDLVPCIRRSDSKPGFYDIAGDGGFRVNMATSGDDFTPGPGERVDILGNPSPIGTASPAYGVAYAPYGNPMLTFTLSDGTVVGDKSLYTNAAGTARGAFDMAVLTIGETSVTNRTTSFSASIASGSTLTWHFTDVENRIAAIASEHGSVSVDGGAAAASDEVWYPSGVSVALVATPDAGYVFDRWTGDVDGLTGLSSATVTVPSARPRTLVATFVKSSYSTDDYVQKGLLLHFDGINNTGSGHDNNATVWKDLSGNGSDAGAVDGVSAPVWHDTGAEWPDTKRYALQFAASGALNAKAGQSMTIEFVASDFGTPYADTLRLFLLKPTVAFPTQWGESTASTMAMSIWRGIFYANASVGSAKGGDFYLGVGGGIAAQGGQTSKQTVYTTNNEFSVTAVLDTENTKYVGYYAGEKCGEKSYNFDLPTTITEGWIGPDYGSQNGFVGRIHAIRLYDHILTADEIAANHAIDELRYYRGMIKTTASPAAYGSPTPRYGLDNVPYGTSQTFSIAESLIEYEDGQSAIRISDDVRAFPTNCTVTARDDGEILHRGSETTFAVEIKTPVLARWDFRLEHALTVSAAGAGTVSVNGGDATLHAVNWGEDGRTVTLRATAGSKAVFAGWTGDIGGVVDPSAAEITVTVAECRAIAASFEPSSYDSSAYVSDGLVLQFDGVDNDIQNDVRCHNPDATVWKDLTGFGSDASQSTGTLPTWTAFGPEWPSVSVRQTLSFTASSQLAAVRTSDRTIEVVATYEDIPSGDRWAQLFRLLPTSTCSNHAEIRCSLWRLLFLTTGDDLDRFCGLALNEENQWGTSKDRVKGFTTNNVISVAFTSLADCSRNECFYRGAYVGGRDITGLSLDKAITSGRICDSDNFKGRIHAIRVYNRRLTAAEIAFNAKVDQKRFFDAMATVTSATGEYGSPTPGYGIKNLTPNVSQTFSIADSLVEYADGQWAIDAGTIRAFPTNCTVRTRDTDTLLHSGSETSFNLTVTESVRAQWSFRIEHALTLETAGSGTVSMNGDAGVSQTVNWGEDGRTVTLKATAGTGYEFAGWSGDLEGVADPSAETISVTVAEARTITASFNPSVYTSASYAQDGLVLQFDGIDNDLVDNVRCHNPDATVWKDLTGNGSDASQSTGAFPTWTAFGPEWPSVSVQQTLSFTVSEALAAVRTSDRTIEVIATYEDIPSGDRWTQLFRLLPASSGSHAEIRCSLWRLLFLTTGDDLDRFCGLALNTSCQWGTDTKLCKRYAQGNEIAVAFTSLADCSHNECFYQGSYVGSHDITGLSLGTEITTGKICDSNGFQGRIHAIRVYNRILTPAEIAFNHKVDRKRFFNGVVRVEGAPSRYGTPSPVYGINNFAPGSSQHFSIADSLVEYPDGVWAIENGLTRTTMINCLVVAGDTVLHSGPEASFDCTITTNCQATWTFDVQHALKVVSPAEGTISVNDGAASLCVTNWGADGRSVRVVATPADGYKFAAWSGDTDGIADVTTSDVTVPVSSERTLVATYAEAHHEPTTCTWKTGVTEGSWSDPQNWGGGVVPGEGDTVNVPSETTITLDTPTAELASLSLGEGATMVVSKWTSAIRATTVTVGTGATIRAAGPFLDGEMSNRVWIVGNTLTVEAGGTITADGAGYAGTNGLAWVGVVKKAYDSGNHLNASPFGGSYGGEQGYMWPISTLYRGTINQITDFGPQTYGSAEWPYDPGSGGGYVTRAGGGAIFLDFTGTVRVDGRISANASTCLCVMNYSNASYGSGGGILVKCDKIAGAGVVSASCDIPEGTAGGRMHGGGGGGRIAVHYDTASQTADACRVRFLARGGQYHNTYDLQFSSFEGGCGTVWFPDNKLLEANLADLPFSGEWAGGEAFDAIAFPAGTVFTNGCVRFTGKTVSFAGDVSLGGVSDGAFAPYGLELDDCTTTVAGDLEISGARLAVKGGALKVAGNLVQRNMTGVSTARRRGGELLAAAAPTNGLDGAVGAAIAVGGRWIMESNAVAYVKCDPTNGAAVAFNVGFFHQEANAIIDARGWGWQGQVNTALHSLKACGPGAGWYGGAGGTHIGFGGGNSAPSCASNDSTERPTLPGSAGVACSGGGVISIVAERNMKIAGALYADSAHPKLNNTAGGAGGTIYLSCQRLVGLPTAKLTATANVYGNGYGGDNGSGGGGAIAIWCAKNLAPDWTVANGVLSVSANYDGKTAVNAQPTDGSIHWGEIPPLGFTVIVR